MKHYIEIQRLRTQDVVVDDTLTLEKNTDAFIQGDIISITEKIDGANSSIYYDKKLEDRKSTRLNSSHVSESRMPSSA